VSAAGQSFVEAGAKKISMILKIAIDFSLALVVEANWFVCAGSFGCRTD
jgi:hypothetical protein